MRIEDLSVVLRPRSGWEAVELGFALSRRHARVIWLSWLATTLPVFAVLNALGWWLDLLWLPPLLLWWLKPAFERVPLFVISRGVFGQQPGVRETLRGQFQFARSIWPWLLWLRLSPSRALLMPVDLLEGVSGPLRSARRQALARNASGTAVLILLVCLHVEAIVGLGLIGLVLTFTPIEFMEPAAQAVWENLFEAPPPWAQLVMNLIYWSGVSLMAPFYVGAGFALYLNRRTQIEAWDIELGFRRMAARLSAGGRIGAALLAPLVAVLLSLPAPAVAMQAEPQQDPLDAIADPAPAEVVYLSSADADEDWDLPIDLAGPGGSATRTSKDGDRFAEVFAHEHQSDADAFVNQAAEVFEQARLNPVTTETVWVPRKRENDATAEQRASPPWLRSLGRGIALIIENIFWLLAAALLVLLIATHRRWLPVLGVELAPRRVGRIRHEAADAAVAALPEDIIGAAEALWQQGQPRAALALLYAGGVERVIEATGEALPPGSTEADCLRRARRLGSEGFGALFPRIVRHWQAAAYADRLPAEADFRALVEGWRHSTAAAAEGATA
jgi:hypothetical protein